MKPGGDCFARSRGRLYCAAEVSLKISCIPLDGGEKKNSNILTSFGEVCDIGVHRAKDGEKRHADGGTEFFTMKRRNAAAGGRNKNR